MLNEILKETDQLLEKRLEGLDKDLTKVRTGRASVSLLDGIKADYYGKPTLLNQMASLSTPDARTIVVAPFEKKLIGDVERAIHMADIGIQPSNDGNVIRLPIPPLTEDRRKEIAKSIKKLGEETKVLLRKVRQDQNTKVKKAEKDKLLTEDESKKLQKSIQTSLDNSVKLVESKVEKKEKEIMTI
jgi:ribosome recycling factor